MNIAGLEMNIPDNWEDRSLYTFVAPVEEVRTGMTTQSASFRTNVVITRKPIQEGRTLDAVGSEIEERTKRDFGDVKVQLENGPAVMGQPSKRASYTVVDPRGGAPVAQVQYVFMHGGFEWMMTFSVASIALKEQMPTFDKIVTQLKPA
jgi:hypothetical protein